MLFELLEFIHVERMSELLCVLVVFALKAPEPVQSGLLPSAPFLFKRLESGQLPG